MPVHRSLLSRRWLSTFAEARIWLAPGLRAVAVLSSGFLVCGSAYAAGAQVEAAAGVPYAALYGVLKPGLVVATYPRLLAVQKVESRLPDVSNDSIEIWIEAAAGRLQVSIDSNGSADFPLQAELLAENPPVYSNQPSGSLNIQMTLEARVPDQLRFPYRVVWETVEQANQALAQIDRETGDAQVNAVEYYFDAAGGQMQVRSANVDETLIADHQRRVVLRADARWLDDDAQVLVQGRLQRAVPRLRDR